MDGAPPANVAIGVKDRDGMRTTNVDATGASNLQARIPEVEGRRGGGGNAECGPGRRGNRRRVEAHVEPLAAVLVRSLIAGRPLRPGRGSRRSIRKAPAVGSGDVRQAGSARSRSRRTRPRFTTSRSRHRAAARHGTNAIEAAAAGTLPRRRASARRRGVTGRRQHPHDRRDDDPGEPEVVPKVDHVAGLPRTPRVRATSRLYVRRQPGQAETCPGDAMPLGRLPGHHCPMMYI
jgi:hypothetical protein